ncbi:MAG: hypothetical protein WD003_00585 [Candidatus Paceibacterota bacterium]
MIFALVDDTTTRLEKSALLLSDKTDKEIDSWIDREASAFRRNIDSILKKISEEELMELVESPFSEENILHLKEKLVDVAESILQEHANLTCEQVRYFITALQEERQ